MRDVHAAAAASDLLRSYIDAPVTTRDGVYGVNQHDKAMDKNDLPLMQNLAYCVNFTQFIQYLISCAEKRGNGDEYIVRLPTSCCLSSLATFVSRWAATRSTPYITS